MAVITIVEKIPPCETCGKWAGYLETRILGVWGNMCLRCWCTAILAFHINRTEQFPLLGHGIGQLWMTEAGLKCEGVRDRDWRGCDAEAFAKQLGKPDRYTLLIENNEFVMSENRRYEERGPIGLVSGVADIAWRIIPFETSVRSRQTKVWLRGDW